jgi:hypothetical protein
MTDQPQPPDANRDEKSNQNMHKNMRTPPDAAAIARRVLESYSETDRLPWRVNMRNLATAYLELEKKIEQLLRKEHGS